MSAIGEALEAASVDRFNAFTAVHDHAAAADPPPGPLSGVPMAVKDLIDETDQVTTAGSAFYRHRAERTAPCLARLEAAGAVTIGRTNLHEFAFGFSSENPWFGPVLNPRDTRLSPGGSSGGSAAAVAAGVVPLAIGTDTGGSVRVPAALCGVIGLKVTHGLIPTEGVFPLMPSLDTVGAIGLSLAIVEIATAVMAGPTWPSPGPEVTRLVVPEEWLAAAPLQHGVQRALDDFVEGARSAGMVVEFKSIPDLVPLSIPAIGIAQEVAEVHGEWRRSGLPYGEDVAERIDAAIEMAEDADTSEEARRWRETVTQTMAAAVSPDTLMVTPTVAGMDKEIGVEEIAGVHYRKVLSWFTALVNATSHPALSVPLAGDGLQPSIQLVGPRHSEPTLIACARRLAEFDLVTADALPSE